MNEDEIKQTDLIPLDYKRTKLFHHCKNCIEQFLGSPLHDVMTPKEYSLLEMGTYEFTYPDKTTAEIMVVWCKRCGRPVWDSRNLVKKY